MIDRLLALEASHAELSARLALPEVHSDPKAVPEISQALAEIDPLVPPFRRLRRPRPYPAEPPEPPAPCNGRTRGEDLDTASESFGVPRGGGVGHGNGDADHKGTLAVLGTASR